MSDIQNSQTTKSGNKNKGLGRGLGSLLGATEEGAFSKTTSVNTDTLKNLTSPTERPQPTANIPAHARLWQLAIEKVQPNPQQPRQVFDKTALQDLSQSIKEKGIIQPILVRKINDEKFEIIAGERRWRAAQLAGLKEVPAVIKEAGDQEGLELALIENIQRENLNPMEEAEAYDFLMKTHNLTQEILAQKVGKERATVANVLRLLQLVPDVRKLVSEKQISLGQAKVLLSIQDPKAQVSLAQRTVSENLSVRALEKLAARAKVVDAKPTAVLGDQLREISARNLKEELQKLFGSKVQLDYKNGQGKIMIHFYSDQELNELAEKLRKSCQN